MAKIKQKKITRIEKFSFPLEKINFIILGIGVAVVIMGYVFMALPDNPDAFPTRTLSPIILVFAYLVIIPIGILYRPKGHKTGKQSNRKEGA